MKGESEKFPVFYNKQTLMNRILAKVKNNTVFYFIDLMSYLGTEHEVALNYFTSTIPINSITLYVYLVKIKT